MDAPASDWLRHFRLLLWNRWTELNETWQEARSRRSLPSFFRADRKNKMAALASDLLIHCRLLIWNCWTEFNETRQEARLQCALPSLCFSRLSKKNKMATLASDLLRYFRLLWNALNGIQRNLTGSKISTSSTKFVFFRQISKQKWPSCPDSMTMLGQRWHRVVRLAYGWGWEYNDGPTLSLR